MPETLLREPPRRPSPEPATPPASKPSKVEIAKTNGDFLRGTIRDVLDGEAPAFGHDDVQLLKFHGVYQQEDRDAREAQRHLDLEKPYQFMVRTRIPGGRLRAAQYLAFDDLARRVALHGALRVTTRQTFQFHGVIKADLASTVRAIHEALVTTLAACGDVGRNVMVSPAPRAGVLHRRVLALGAEISRALEPRSRAYHEIWLDGEKVAGGDDEPLYGPAYLPRKLKVGVALADDNAVDVHSQDIGLIALPDAAGEDLAGVGVLVGGGLGMTHRKEDTFARLGTPLGVVDVDDTVAAVRAIAEIFRDHGERGDRKHARLKYLIEAWGPDRFRDVFAHRSAIALRPWIDPGPLRYRDWLGAHPRGDGRWFYGVHVPAGRILDQPARRLATALRRIAGALDPDVVLTPTQNLLLDGLDEAGVAAVEATLAAYGAPASTLSGTRRYAMACPALPTCGLALAEAERFLPTVIDGLEAAIAALGLGAAPLTVRMTGCPNGCARPYTADIGLVGRRAGHYDVYIGGRLAGDRLASLWAENVAGTDVVAVLRPLLTAWADDRQGGPAGDAAARDEGRDEAFGDFVERTVIGPARGGAPPDHRLTGFKRPLRDSMNGSNQQEEP